MSQPPTVSIFESPEQAALAGAERFVDCAQEAISDHGFFCVALAGGSTPQRMYELIATDQFKDRIDWSGVHLFFGDERCVPPDHPDSNYGMVYRTLISKVAIPEKNVHRIIGEIDPETSAQLYEAELKSLFPEKPWPQFDLVLLGLGDDGHTASLFPGTSALSERQAWVVPNWVQKLGVYRITLTVPAINGAANIMFVVTGANKATSLAAVLNGPPDLERLPAQLIRPESGTLTWFVDTQAARQVMRHES